MTFCGMIGAADHRCHKHTYHHRVGACVVHLGARRHGADHITAGERLNRLVFIGRNLDRAMLRGALLQCRAVV